ncbi:MAG: DUF1320 family protein [Urechidicola sp.]|nr:DUF1320 family protein [Urechidicola sp.]
MAFLDTSDWDVLIREEIRDVLIETGGDQASQDSKFLKAEEMAISQLKNFLYGHYDTDQIFIAYDAQNDTRNAHIVMTTIDCALYHLYTSIAPERIPEHRATRYEDALSWLKDVSRGKVAADLPRKTDEAGEEEFGFRISSERANEDNRW